MGPRHPHYLDAVNDWIASSARRARLPPATLPTADFESATSTIAICGSPDEMVERMCTARKLLHLDVQLLMFDMGGVCDDELFEAIELAGAEVIPHLENPLG